MATPNSAGFVVTNTPSGQLPIDNLLAPQKWGTTNLTYSFGEYSTSYYLPTYGAYNEPWNGFQPLTATQRNATQNALANYSDISNLTFTQVTDSQSVAGDLRYAQTSASATAHAYLPAATTTAGDVWFGTTGNKYNSDVKGSYSYYTFLHEVGHALGLEHPHTKATNPTQDYTLYSVMSYRSYEGAPIGPGFGITQGFFPTTLMMNDISAIQHMYGANYATRNGDTVYSWNPGQQLLETIWDGGGNDTISWANQTSAATINLQAGEFSKLGPSYWTGQSFEARTLGIARGAVIENAMGGSGSDSISGNSAGNKLEGKAGNDILAGGEGNDSLYGDKGVDTLTGGEGNDYLVGNVQKDILTGGGGVDWFYFSGKNDSGDIITDYNLIDEIEIRAAGFGGGLTAGGFLTAAQFNIGSSAKDKSDRIMYDKLGSGGLYFDADGIGSSAKLMIADLASGLGFNQSEIYLV